MAKPDRDLPNPDAEVPDIDEDVRHLDAGVPDIDEDVRNADGEVPEVGRHPHHPHLAAP